MYYVARDFKIGIERKPTNRGSIIKIVNYDKYQTKYAEHNKVIQVDFNRNRASNSPLILKEEKKQINNQQITCRKPPIYNINRSTDNQKVKLNKKLKKVCMYGGKYKPTNFKLNLKNKDMDIFETAKDTFIKSFQLTDDIDKEIKSNNIKDITKQTFTHFVKANNVGLDEIRIVFDKIAKEKLKDQNHKIQNIGYYFKAFYDFYHLIKNEISKKQMLNKREKELANKSVTVNLPNKLIELNHKLHQAIKYQIGDSVFNTWFKNTYLIGFKKNGNRRIAIILTPNNKIKNCILLHYLVRLERIIEKIIYDQRQVCITEVEIKIPQEEVGRIEITQREK